MEVKRVKSAVDIWFKIIFWIVPIVIVISFVLFPKDIILSDLFICIIPIGLLFWIYFDTYYELRDSYLYCKCGPFFQKIYYDKIISLKLRNNIISSSIPSFKMAMSLKRIEIKQHRKNFFTVTTLISPIKREEFLNELKKRCVNIEKQKI